MLRRVRGVWSGSLRGRLVILFLLAAVVPVAITTVLSYQRAEGALMEQLNQRLLDTAVYQADQISSFLSDRVRQTESLAALPQVKAAGVAKAAGKLDSQTMASAVAVMEQSFKGSDGAFENVFLAGADGKLFADGIGGASIGVDVTSWDFYKPALSGQQFIGEVKPSPVTGKPVAVVAVPIKGDNGSVVAILGGPIDFEKISSRLGAVKIGQTGYAYMTDKTGLVVAHPDKANIFKLNLATHSVPELAQVGQKMSRGESGTGQYYFNGSQRVAGFAPVKAYERYAGQGLAVGSAAQADEALAPVRELLISAVVAALLLAVLALGVAWLFARSICNPIRAVAGVAARAADGDTRHHMDAATEAAVARRDEVGLIAKSFVTLRQYMAEAADTATEVANGNLNVNVQVKSEADVLGNALRRMVDGLRSLVGEVAGSAARVAEAGGRLSDGATQAGSVTHQIASTIQQVATGAGEQTRGVTMAADTVNQVNAAVEQVSRLAKEVSVSAEQTDKVALDGGESVRKSVEAMERVRDSAGKVSERIDQLSQRSSEIGLIVETIDDIAAQTNLLALNAAIEAARAGEHGRGFAVVADEVRNLAERSSRATKEISELIKTVQENTAEAVQATSMAAAQVDSSVVLAQEVGESLRKIKAASASVVQSADTVVKEAERISLGSREVVQSIEAISSVSEENAAAAEEVSAATEEMTAQVADVAGTAQTLAHMAGELREVVSRFRLEDRSVAEVEDLRSRRDVRSLRRAG